MADKPIVKVTLDGRNLVSEELEVRKKFEIRREWDNLEVINSISVSKRATVEVAAATKEGLRCVVLTINQNGKSSNIPICIPIETRLNNGTEAVFCVEAFKEAFDEAVEKAKTMPLYDEKHAVLKERGGKYYGCKL